MIFLEQIKRICLSLRSSSGRSDGFCGHEARSVPMSDVPTDMMTEFRYQHAILPGIAQLFKDLDPCIVNLPPRHLLQQSLERYQLEQSIPKHEGAPIELKPYKDSEEDPLSQSLRYISHSIHQPFLGVLVRNDCDAPSPPRIKRATSYEVDDFVCDQCGATQTPEKRMGPKGKRTLCNRCGLKWARHQKK